MTQGHPMFIPPPPLPQFYQHTEVGTRAASCSSSSTDRDQQISGSARETRRSVRVVSRAKSPIGARPDIQDVSVRRDSSHNTMNVSPARAPAQEPLWFNVGAQQHYDDVPPLAVYHICRLCLRPRSARYHREHPIAVNGMPPPPGICRRCRVSTVEEETHVIELIDAVEESEDVKLGVRCLIPDENYISHEELTRDLPLRPDICTTRQPIERRDIEYRHVRVVGVSPERPAPARVVMKEPKVQNRSGSHKTSDARSEIHIHLDAYRKERSESDIRQLARDEIDQYRRAAANATPEWTNSEIRRLAREEVERYRQAERKVEAHGHAYAHGRLVPVQHRIAASADAPKDKPWKAVPHETKGKLESWPKKDRREFSSSSDVEKVVVIRRNKNITKDPLNERQYANKSCNRSDRNNLEFVSEKTRRMSIACAGDSRNPATVHGEVKPILQPRYETVEVVSPFSGPEPGRIQEFEVHESSSRRSDSEYWSDEEPAWTAESRISRATVSEQSRKSQSKHNWQDNEHREIQRGSRIVDTMTKAGVHRRSSEHADEQAACGTTTRRGSASLPHTRVCRRDSLIVPPPQAQKNTSHEEGNKSARPDDQSYVYIERTKTAVNKPRGSRASATRLQGNSYVEKEVLLQRKTPGKAQPKTNSVSGSGRVRFSNRVEVSPTPPGSDASSAQFRESSRMKQKVALRKLSPIDPRADEHRGRSRSRTSSGQTGYIYQKDSRSLSERSHVTSSSIDAESTSKAATSTGQRQSTSTATPNLAGSARPFTSVLSESPSREKLRLAAAAARASRNVPGPPYADPNDQLSDDLEVQDGSERDTDEGGRKRRSRGYRRK